MRRYFTNELAFDLPDLAFEDKTVTVLEAPTSAESALTIVVQRFPMPAERTLREIVTEHLSRSRKTRPGFSILHERDLEIAGGPGLDVGLRWKSDAKLVYARNVFFRDQASWLLIGSNTDLARRAEADRAFDIVVGSVRLRGE